ncbi:MAG: inositol monophosphatase family protein, partial [bacterium]
MKDIEDPILKTNEIRRELIGLISQTVSKELAELDGQLHEQEKGSQDLVTQADIKIERELRRQLPELLAGSSVRGEEGDGTYGTSDSLQWVVDPIDGTVNLSRGYGQYSSVVALVENGQPILAVVYEPLTGD